MELFIETLTGTSIVLHVSPLDTVLDVKTYIEKLEGIPASQQHLVWHSSELKNEEYLQDSSVYSGATLRLVLGMQGGPVSTRRVPVEQPTLVEYFTEANHRDLLPSASSRHRPVTVVVCQSGDHLKFYQLMPGTDVSSPLSCSQSLSESDVDTSKKLLTPTDERHEENQRTRVKMKLVRSQMERCSLVKERKEQTPLAKSVLPTPPSTSPPVFINRLRHSPSSEASVKPAVLDVVRKLATSSSAVSSTQPPDHPEHVPDKELLSLQNAGAPRIAGTAAVEMLVSQENELSETVVKSSSISSLSEDQSLSEAEPKRVVRDNVCEQSEIYELETTVANHGAEVVESKEANVSRGSVQPVNRQVTSKPEVCHIHDGKLASSAGRPDQLRGCIQAQLDDARSKSVAATSPARHPAPAAVKRVAARNDGSLMLRSLDSRETRVVSGLLTSLVRDRGSRLSSGGCYQLVRTERGSSTPGKKPPQTSPKKALAATPVRCVEKAAGSTHCRTVASSAVHVQSVDVPETSAKRCLVCRKRTSLAASFQCRCGGNFCSVHRNAEAHGCRFDYKTEGRRLLEQSNPVIAADKLPKI